MSPDGDQEYFGDGIAEELLNELTRLAGLRVAGRTSSFSFKQSDDDLQTIGETLNVSSILEGSVRKDGGCARVLHSLASTPRKRLKYWSALFSSYVELSTWILNRPNRFPCLAPYSMQRGTGSAARKLTLGRCRCSRTARS